MITKNSPPQRTQRTQRSFGRFFASVSSVSSVVVLLLVPARSFAQGPPRDPSRCSPQMMSAPLGDPSAGPQWNGWSPTPANTRFQPADQAGLTAAQVPGLKLKWAFGFPDTLSAYGQPTIAAGRVFIGTQNGTERLRSPCSSRKTKVPSHGSAANRGNIPS